jgi:hypothetical protein
VRPVGVEGVRALVGDPRRRRRAGPPARDGVGLVHDDAGAGLGTCDGGGQARQPRSDDGDPGHRVAPLSRVGQGAASRVALLALNASRATLLARVSAIGRHHTDGAGGET